MTYSKRFRKNSQEKASTDFTQFPFTHDSIFKRILLYAGGVMLKDKKKKIIKI